MALAALLLVGVFVPEETLGIRIPDGSASAVDHRQRVEVAVFALGSFWRSEAVFGCLPGVVRTTAGYSGGVKINPEYRNPGGHAECVKVSLSISRIREFFEFLSVNFFIFFLKLLLSFYPFYLRFTF